jgi:hypothetical protein
LAEEVVKSFASSSALLFPLPDDWCSKPQCSASAWAALRSRPFKVC